MFKNWKTTLLGIVTGLIPVGQSVLGAMATGQHVDFGKLGMGIGIMALGAFAKDNNVTGGTIKQ